MDTRFNKILQGYQGFRDKYALGDQSVMQHLSDYGQRPEIMVVACCDSRVDPSLILQCDPGDLFVVRNIANIVPPYEKDGAHHGTSAALEFGICYLKVKHLILLGHSQCGGIQALLDSVSTTPSAPNDFIDDWVSIINHPGASKTRTVDSCAKYALKESLHNCLNFPWIKDKIQDQSLIIHLWYFDIKMGQIFKYVADKDEYLPLDANKL